MTEADLETALRSALAAKGGEAGTLSPDELLKLRSGELTDEEREDLLERASASAEAAEALLDAVRFPELGLGEESEGVTDADLARLWTGFRKRLEKGSEPAPRARSRRLTAPIWSFFGSLRFAQAVAATLLLICIGLSWTLFTRPPGSVGPSLNVRIVELVPESESSERTETSEARGPTTADGALLVLTLRGRSSHSAYEVTIEDSTGAPVWSSRALERAPEGFFTLALPRGFLPAGSYRIVLRGEADGRLEPVAAYGLTIER